MKITTIKEYFFTYIVLKSALKPEEEKLAGKHVDFLVHCCFLNYKGVDLNDFEALWENCKDLEYITSRNSLSGYKLRLATHKWIKSKKGKFILPRHLDIKEEDGFMLVLDSKGERVATKKLMFKIEPSYELA